MSPGREATGLTAHSTGKVEEEAVAHKRSLKS